MKEPKKSIGRYFGSRLGDIGEVNTVSSDKPSVQKSEDLFFCEGRLADYVSLDVSSEEDKDMDKPMDTDIKMSENDPSDTPSDELNELIKPVRIMK